MADQSITSNSTMDQQELAQGDANIQLQSARRIATDFLDHYSAVANSRRRTLNLVEVQTRHPLLLADIYRLIEELKREIEHLERVILERAEAKQPRTGTFVEEQQDPVALDPPLPDPPRWCSCWPWN